MDTELIAQMWLNGDKAEVICLTANCSNYTLHKVISERNLPRRGRTVMSELTRKILSYPRGTPFAVIIAELGCTASQVQGARYMHRHIYNGKPRTSPVRAETLTDDDKRLAAGLFGHLSFSEIARKLECTRSAVKQYATEVGFYESKADHLRALIAAGHSREHCLAVSGAARNEYRRIAAELCVKHPPIIKPGDKYQHWTVIAADAGMPEAALSGISVSAYVARCGYCVTMCCVVYALRAVDVCVRLVNYFYNNS